MSPAEHIAWLRGQDQHGDWVWHAWQVCDAYEALAAAARDIARDHDGRTYMTADAAPCACALCALLGESLWSDSTERLAERRQAEREAVEAIMELDSIGHLRGCNCRACAAVRRLRDLQERNG